MYQDMNSTFAVQEQRLNETGHSLTLEQREHMDKSHRIWAAIVAVICFGLVALMIAYPSLARVLTV